MSGCLFYFVVFMFNNFVRVVISWFLGVIYVGEVNEEIVG